MDDVTALRATAAEMRDALLAKHARGDYTEEGWADADDGLECRACGDWCDTPARLDALIAQVEAEARAGLVEAWRLLEYQDDRQCVTFRDHQPPTCETHWSEWPMGADSCEWRQAAHAILAAIPAPEPSSGAAPVEERCVWEWKGDGGGPCDLPEESFPHPCQHDPHEPWDMCHPFTRPPRSVGAGDGRTDR